MDRLKRLDLVRVVLWGIVVMAALAFVTTLWSAIRSPEAVTGPDVIFSTFGWTLHFIVISAVVWLPFGIIVTIIQLRED